MPSSGTKNKIIYFETYKNKHMKQSQSEIVRVLDWEGWDMRSNPHSLGDFRPVGA